ncbi:MAG TPA: YebC/PmpR family DNA-binding transcriptional regulator [Patescibacteria group bacterium]|nr:YebC/PmpR family DNA-binding transcriptional regulator [Patescibacteria group bacterium]
MSGHSKWHNIQQRKGKRDARRSNEFTKAAKAITVAAQKGGDPAMNFSLRIAIDKAKETSMPKDNIDRAIKRGTGELGGEQMEELMYEGFGPGGVTILIKVVTDNKNRTVSNLKHILSERGGSLGGAGSVQWMFEQAGIITVAGDTVSPPSRGGAADIIGGRGGGSRDELELTLIESGAEDIRDTDEGIEIKTKVENFQKVEQKAKELGLEIKDSGIRWIAKDHLEVPADVQEKLADLFAELEAHDDVEDYYTNAE